MPDASPSRDAPADDVRRRVLAAFAQAWGGTPDALVRAPGRVNLIGEHTDYNDGYVLPCAIDYATVVAVRRRADRCVQVVAADLDQATDRFTLDAPAAGPAQPRWTHYVRGMVQALQEAGHALCGAELAIAGDVPQGAGLSSSAALEVAVGRAFDALSPLPGLTPTRLAQIAQQAENRHVQVQCGIMDQLASAAGQRDHALLIDCRSLALRPVPLPAGAAVMIVHSRVERGLVGSEYNTRRRQCEAAAAHYGVPALRDLAPERLLADRRGLDDTVWRRARHIVSDSARAVDAAAALAAGDLVTLGELMAASHASMRDDFEITVPAVDRLVEIAQRAIGRIGGARMTGGGFGGCVVAVLPRERVDAVRQAIEADYRAPNGRAATVWVTGAADGAGRLT